MIERIKQAFTRRREARGITSCSAAARVLRSELEELKMIASALGDVPLGGSSVPARSSTTAYGYTAFHRSVRAAHELSATWLDARRARRFRRRMARVRAFAERHGNGAEPAQHDGCVQPRWMVRMIQRDNRMVRRAHYAQLTRRSQFFSPPMHRPPAPDAYRFVQQAMDVARPAFHDARVARLPDQSLNQSW